LYWLTRNLSDHGPLLIVVDDAHWADIPSLLFVHYLAARVANLRVAVTLSARNSGAGAEADLIRRIAATAGVTVMTLRPLTAQGTSRLIRGLLGASTPDRLCDVCHTVTNGNPFLLHELAKAIRAEEMNDVDAAAHVSQLIPEAVASHVLVRLWRLGTASIGVARAIAVLGANAELRHVAALAGLSEWQTANAVDLLASADILASGLPLQFAHPLLSEAVYADTPPGARIVAHGRAAKVLADTGSDPERISAQLLLAEPANSDWALRALTGAAEAATHRGAPHAAVEYLHRALRELPDPPTQRQVLLRLGIAECQSAHPSAAEHLAAALAMTFAPVDRAYVAQELAVAYNLEGRFVESAAVLDEVIDTLGDGDPDLRYSLEAEAAVLAVTSGAARKRLRSRMSSFRARAPMIADDPSAAPLLAVIASELAETDGSASVAAAYAERAFAYGRLLSREGAVAAIGAATLVITDHARLAENLLNAAIAAAESRGSIQALRIALATRSFARCWSGQIAGAEADARLSLNLSPPERSDSVRVLTVAWLARALIERGELTEASDILGLEEANLKNVDSMLFQQLGDSCAQLLLDTNRYREAYAQLMVRLEWQRRWGCRNPGWTSTRSFSARAAHALGEREAARQLATEDLEAATAFGTPHAIGIALRTMALVSQRSAVGQLSEAVAVLQRSEARLELARTQVELGSTLRRTGARRDAVGALQSGLELAHECGSTLIAARARAELRIAGARPRRVHVSGREALTPSEVRIAAMAKDGLSNREIAQSLFLSPKTVETHLGNIYRKLNIHTRNQIAREFERATADR
jgi:DNA-binding CsgD family transcriptional regulator